MMRTYGGAKVIMRRHVVSMNRRWSLRRSLCWGDGGMGESWRFPAYVDDAAASGARAFNIPEQDWAEMVARKDIFGGTGGGSEVWIRNTRFLDRALARGSEARFASDPFDPLNAGSFFERELQYLRARGAM
jgi:hypothetical protein